MAVVVEVADGNAGRILEDVGQCIACRPEVAVAVVHVQSRPNRVILARELVSTADDDQIRSTIPVGVEERRASVFSDTVGGDRRLLADAEGAITLLDEQLAGLPLRPTDKKVVESITIDIGDRELRTFTR